MVNGRQGGGEGAGAHGGPLTSPRGLLVWVSPSGALKEEQKLVKESFGVNSTVLLRKTCLRSHRGERRR